MVSRRNTVCGNWTGIRKCYSLLQLANFVNLIASGGVWHPPKLLQDQAESPSQAILDQRIVAPLLQGMVAVVNDPNGGTAKVAKIEGFTVAGKTGTAQIISHETRKNLTNEEKELRKYQNHAWFAGFAPAEAPKLPSSSWLSMVRRWKSCGTP